MRDAFPVVYSRHVLFLKSTDTGSVKVTSHTLKPLKGAEMSDLFLFVLKLNLFTLSPDKCSIGGKVSLHEHITSRFCSIIDNSSSKVILFCFVLYANIYLTLRYHVKKGKITAFPVTGRGDP
jgi:hypothetical protein